MKKKIIGIFVIMLMVATVIPVTGTIQESEQKNSALSQNHKTEFSYFNFFFIGFVRDREYYTSNVVIYRAIFVLEFSQGPWKNHFNILLNSEIIQIPRYGIGYLGKHFICYLL